MNDKLVGNSGDVEVRYRKSSHFRVIYAEGCYGGVSPRGMIRSSFYSERGAMPTLSVLEVKDGNVVGEEIKEGGVGIVREIDVEVVMDFNSAVAYYAWLGDKIEAMRQSFGIDDATWETMKNPERK